MNRITLTHLTAAAVDGSVAEIEFGDRLNVIFGASDTGKSFIASAIDFLVGAKSVKRIPESEPFAALFLGLALADGGLATLRRQTTGGPFYIYNSEVRPPTSEGGRRLASKHSSENENNISRYLLAQCGFEDFRVRTNRELNTRSLSFRDIARLCIVSESEMFSERSPLFSGRPQSETVEKATFRLLLENQDDSDLAPRSGDAVERKVSLGKVELLDQLIAEVSNSVSVAGTEIELAAQLERVEATIDATWESLQERLGQRDLLSAQGTEISNQRAEVETAIRHLGELIGRFKLLDTQYSSDLARLETVREVGSLLGYFTVGTCAFCGAAPEDQLPNDHLHEEVTQLDAAVTSEVERTMLHRDDLHLTLDDLAVQLEETNAQQANLMASQSRIIEQIAEIDQSIQEPSVELRDLIVVRERISSAMDALQRSQRLSALRLELDVEPVGRIDRPVEIAFSPLQDFNQTLTQVLEYWGIPGWQSAYFDPVSSDLVVGGQARAVRGKGIRAVLHSAFNVALAQYCYDRDYPHPGFVVLDSPLVTYRDPDAKGPDELLSTSVKDRFFRYLDEEFSGQSVVLENVDPPVLSGSAFTTYFTKQEHDRYGFFPPIQDV